MSWSPFHVASLPSLRPGQSSPAGPSIEKPALSHVPSSSSSQFGQNATHLTHHSSAIGTWSPERKAAPLGPLTVKQSEQHVKAKTQDATLRSRPSLTGSAASRSSPNELQKKPEEQVSAHRKSLAVSIGKRSDQSSTRTAFHNDVNSAKYKEFFFRLTDEELAVFRRKHRKGPTYAGFSDSAIAKELNRLGRGWDGYVRARRRAEEQGSLDEFLRHFQTERRLMSTGLPLPVGAISMQVAAAVAEGSSQAVPGQTSKFLGHDRAKVDRPKELSMADVGIQPKMVADWGVSTVEPEDLGNKGSYEYAHDQYASGFHSELPEPEPTEIGIAQSDLTNDYQAPDSMAKSEANFQAQHWGRPKGSKNKTIALSSLLDRPRPRRVEARPDYRIRRIRERYPDLPPKPPSPTPRDLYNDTQPQFLQFMCEWTGCKAILNNLARLRKHVGIVHGQEARNTLCCGWGRCGRDDSTGVLSIFRCIEEFDEHLQKLHMESVKWHLGDGRFGQGVVVKARGMGDTSYLFRNGKQITPSIKNQRPETLAEWRARKERLKEILLKTALNAPSDTEGVEIGEDTQDSILS
ncbi:hypothetical protein VP1G_09978 [Cytospora mali]|uniref:C2H2-type domain-containing protein n=1 Tax=Cytospora mali TaxID=578113 RepID=A0A194VG46_CYTMA|nr:hypothetical protein VP1G_09978 [Valsa mali var. pyri (nom. inval.)]